MYLLKLIKNMAFAFAYLLKEISHPTLSNIYQKSIVSMPVHNEIFIPMRQIS